MAKNNPEEALVEYLQVLEKLPWDIVMEKKVAEAYFRLKNWSSAYEHFSKIPIGELKKDEKKKMFSALFFQDTELNRNQEIQKFSLEPGELEYFTIIDTCYKSTDECVKNIQSYTGSFSLIQRLQDNISKASRISPDLAYRNFSLASEFYLLGEYRAAYEISQSILKARSDYFDVQKLAWFSLFFLGRYTEARTILKKYLEIQPKDIETIIRLGEIAWILKEYIEANLYLNNAVQAGYLPKANIERQLAYNYSLLWDTAAMVKVLSYLLLEEESVEDDFAVAISLAFSRGENARGYVWSMEWLKKFPNSPIIAPLYMTALRLIWRGNEVERFATTLTGEVLSSPLYLLEMAIFSYDSGDYTGSKDQFQKIYELDGSADFSLEAENYLKEIEQLQNPWGGAPSDDSWENEKKSWWF